MGSPSVGRSRAGDRVGAHQTGHNSGVVHAGIYYKPGSLKARLCTRGRDLLRDYCAEHRLPYDECGKLVVAVSTVELDRFDALEKTARDNGVPGLRRLDGAEIQEVGPNAVLVLRREGAGVRLADVRSTLGWPGFWRMARTHWRTGVKELRGSLSTRAYMRVAQRYVPEIGARDVVRAGSGSPCTGRGPGRIARR